MEKKTVTRPGGAHITTESQPAAGEHATRAEVGATRHQRTGELAVVLCEQSPLVPEAEPTVDDRQRYMHDTTPEGMQQFLNRIYTDAKDRAAIAALHPSQASWLTRQLIDQCFAQLPPKTPKSARTLLTAFLEGWTCLYSDTQDYGDMLLTQNAVDKAISYLSGATRKLPADDTTRLLRAAARQTDHAPQAAADRVDAIEPLPQLLDTPVAPHEPAESTIAERSPLYETIPVAMASLPEIPQPPTPEQSEDYTITDAEIAAQFWSTDDPNGLLKDLSVRAQQIRTLFNTNESTTDWRSPDTRTATQWLVAIMRTADHLKTLDITDARLNSIVDEIAGKLITSYQEYCRCIADPRIPNHHPGIDIDDLIAEGNIALLTGLKKFNPYSKVPFHLFAHRRIDGAMTDYVRSQGSTIRLPRSALSTLRAYNTSLGEGMSEPEALAAVEDNEARTRSTIAKVKQAKALSLDMLQEATGDAHHPAITDYRPTTVDVDIIDPLKMIKDLEILRVARKNSDKRTRMVTAEKRCKDIIPAYFGLGEYRNNRQSMTELARKHGVSESRISQLYHQGLAALREQLPDDLRSAKSITSDPSLYVVISDNTPDDQAAAH